MYKRQDCDSLAPGKQADLIMIDLHQPNMQPLNNLTKNIVYLSLIHIFLHGPWLPIYGAGSVLILLLLNRLRRKPVARCV